jgi:hypothetical protein
MNDDALWPIEDIPNSSALFLRVAQGGCPDLVLHPGVFKENKGSMSVDWVRYSSAHQTRARQGRPERFGIVELDAGIIRTLLDVVPQLTVTHEPVQNHSTLMDNRAHSAVYGIEVDPKTTLKIRTALYKRFSKWLIRPDEPVTDDGEDKRTDIPVPLIVSETEKPT